jgi:PAS domain S-box-containing protein
MLAYSGAQLLERDVQSATHPDDRAATEGLMRDAIAGKDRSYQLEKRYVRSDGSLVAANLSVSLVRDAAGVPLYFISQIEDITERREGERIKRELAANVSHELRTPLTSIRGALGLIDSGVLGELPVKAQRMMQIAQQNSERMGHIIDDILDVEKIASGKLEVQCETVAVNAFLTEAAAIYQPYGTNYDVRFVFEALPTEAYVQADPHRLMQVMANLLSNAAKFSTPGAEVSIRAIDCGLRMRIEVQDRGTGIPEEFQSRILRPREMPHRA